MGDPFGKYGLVAVAEPYPEEAVLPMDPDLARKEKEPHISDSSRGSKSDQSNVGPEYC